MTNAKTETKGWRNKLSNSFLTLYVSSKKNKRVSSSSATTSTSTCTEETTRGMRLSALGDPLEYGRQMGWLSTSTTSKSSDNNSDTKTTNFLLPLPADESESKAKKEGEGAKKKEYVNQGSLEYHYEYYL